MRFHVENMPKGKYIVVPQVSSERREYVPIGFASPDVLCSDKLRLIPNATIYQFGILNSSAHMAWMRAVCCRLKSDYSYSNTIVYNNFVWPEVSEKVQAKIAATAQAILDARNRHPNASLADLYDPTLMPAELRKAHRANDAAVLAAYGMKKEASEGEVVARLMELYRQRS